MNKNTWLNYLGFNLGVPVSKTGKKRTFEVSGGKITGKSVFMVHLADYKIKIPNTVVNNIAEDIQVTVDVNLEQLKK